MNINFIIKAILGIMFILTLSWGAVSILVYLISLCFDFNFTIKIGTGVWLSLCLLNMSLKISTYNKKGGE